MSSQKRKKSTFLIGVLYFMQGLSNALPFTLVYTYAIVPSYYVLSLLEVAKFAYATKWLISPFIQVYNFFNYGRRKTWVVIGSFGMAATNLFTSFFTNQKHIIIAASLAIIHMCFSVSEDVSLDALALKDIEDPDKIGFIQSIGERCGRVFGSFVFLKLVSVTFGVWLGLSGRIMQISTFFVLISAIISCVTFYMHFSYKEPVIKSELKMISEKKGFCETLQIYKIFFNKRRREFRLIVWFIFVFQGCLFYCRTYKFQLMKDGISKQKINQFNNYCILPAMLITYYHSQKIGQNIWSHLRMVIIIRYFLYLFGFIFEPRNYFLLFLYISADQILDIIHALLDNILIFGFQANEYSAIVISMLNSGRNFSDTAFYQMWVIELVGYRAACVIGFGIQLVVIFYMQRFSQWVQKGQVDKADPDKQSLFQEV